MNKKIEKNPVVDDNQKKTQCSYCGSWIQPGISKCPYCKYKFDEKKVEKVTNKKRIITDFETETKTNLEEPFIPNSRKSSLIFFTAVFVIMLLILIPGFYALGVNVFDVETYTGFFSEKNNIEDEFDGEWGLLSADNSNGEYSEKWFFYNNGSLQISKFSKSKHSDETEVYWGNWKITNDKLMISGDCDFFSYASTGVEGDESSGTKYLTVFDYSFSENNKKLSLSNNVLLFPVEFNKL